MPLARGLTELVSYPNLLPLHIASGPFYQSNLSLPLLLAVRATATVLPPMAPPSSSTLLLAAWAYLHVYQHGFHVSALNGLHEALTCGMSGGEVDRLGSGSGGLQSCVPMLVRFLCLVPRELTLVAF